MTLRPKNLGARLTLWYVLMLAGLVALAWGGFTFLLHRQLLEQLDRFNTEELETVEGLLYFAPDGALKLRDDYHNHRDSKDKIESFLEVLSPKGAILYRNDRLGDRSLEGPPVRGEGVGGYFERSGQLSDGTPVRLVSRAHVLNGRPLLMRLAHSRQPMIDALYDLLEDSLAMAPFVLGAAWISGYFLTRRALTPVDQMVRRAGRITADRLSERLPTGGAEDELGRLARVFNDMLARLEQAFDQIRRFTSDCSHELRTPLAIISSVGEFGLQKDGSREEYRAVVGSMLEEVDRLTSLVDSLLTISRADSGALQLQHSAVPVMEITRDVVSLLEALAEEKSQRIFLEGDESLEVVGDRLFLRQALFNVIHNAVKYSPEGGAIGVRVLHEDRGMVSVEIEDSGPGIPPEDQLKVFERFYRVEKARTRQSGGAGLGLSIAKWAVEAHGGSIHVTSVSGHGSRFCVRLPRRTVGS